MLMQTAAQLMQLSGQKANASAAGKLLLLTILILFRCVKPLEVWNDEVKSRVIRSDERKRARYWISQNDDFERWIVRIDFYFYALPKDNAVPRPFRRRWKRRRRSLRLAPSSLHPLKTRLVRYRSRLQTSSYDLRARHIRNFAPKRYLHGLHVQFQTKHSRITQRNDHANNRDGNPLLETIAVHWRQKRTIFQNKPSLTVTPVGFTWYEVTIGW